MLPPIIVCPQPSNDALRTVIDLLAAAARDDGPGATLIQSRLSDILFVHAMRHWLSQAVGMPGWLNALREPQVGLALGLMHRQAGQPWTVASIAAVVGLARLAFSARFTALVGQSPMRYLTTWRITHATRALRHTDTPLTVSGTRAGYATIAAFSKAFKVSPRTYRATQRHTDWE